MRIWLANKDRIDAANLSNVDLIIYHSLFFLAVFCLNVKISKPADWWRFSSVVFFSYASKVHQNSDKRGKNYNKVANKLILSSQGSGLHTISIDLTTSDESEDAERLSTSGPDSNQVEDQKNVPTRQPSAQTARRDEILKIIESDDET